MNFAEPASQTFGILDAGSSKVVCLIAEQSVAGLRVLGFGHQRSQGVKAGVIVDLEQAEQAIRAAIAQAEKAAGVTLASLYVAVACGRLRSNTFTASTEILAASVSNHDIARLMSGARAYAERDSRMALHMNRITVELDGVPNSLDPAGMAANAMRAEVHAVTADGAPIQNLMLVLERCHLAVAGLYASPLASALSATSIDERHSGVTVIDIGAGTAKLAAFSAGQLVDVAVIPQGGHQMTADIAQSLHTPLNEAERIKVIYGNVISAQSDQHEVFSYPETGSEGRMQQATRAHLGDLLRRRSADILVSLMNRAGPGFGRNGAASSIVLTGGASQMAGFAEFASSVLQCPVRVGLVPQLVGVPKPALSPALATAAGVAMAAAGAFRDHAGVKPSSNEGTYVRRVGEWLKSSF